MKPSIILSALALLAALALVLVSEMRLNQKIEDDLRGTAAPDATEPEASSGSELRDARNDLKRARLKLAAAEQHIVSLAARVNALEG